MKKILVCGLNPAWQKTLSFSRLTLDDVNRADSLSMIASGKGINFARAVRTWDTHAVSVLHPLGGVTGKQIMESLADEGISSVSVTTDAATRTCCTLMCSEDGSATELIEPSGTVSPEEYEKLMAVARLEIGSADALAICGTYPPGIPESCYGELVSFAAEQNKPVLLDACKGLGNALNSGVTLLKINRGELRNMTGEETMENGIRSCLDRYPLEAVAITAGKDCAYIGSRDGITKITVPQIDNAVNPIGAGDTCSGVFFSEYLSGKALSEAFASGLCAATASCMTGTPAGFEKEKALYLKDMVKFCKLKG